MEFQAHPSQNQATGAVDHEGGARFTHDSPLYATIQRWIAEGAIMRLICGEQCFEAYRACLWAHAHPVVYAAE